jgi:thiamine biosynthesis lipoprotein
MNRRDFLHPRRLAQSAGHVLGALDALRTRTADPADFALVRCARRAMATTFEVMVPFGVPAGVEAAEDALDDIDRLESQLTVYREDSEVSRLNRRAAAEEVPVEDGLFDLLSLAARLSRDTGGTFDVSVGALVKAWGFYRRRAALPSPGERSEVMNRIGMKFVALDPERRTVRFRRPGLEINLGSIGKGYALDRVADLLRVKWGLASALLHGGHSSVSALGTPPGDALGWAVRIRHPWQPERVLAVVRLRDRGLGTSAATFQHLEYNGRKLGHILDPRTGWPAEGMASATVLAPTAAEADGLATAFFILGLDRARDYCETHPGISAVLLPEGDQAQPVVIGLAPGEVSLARG